MVVNQITLNLNSILISFYRNRTRSTFLKLCFNEYYCICTRRHNIKIHESIVLKNINHLNISTIIGFNNTYDKFNQFFEIDKFTYVKKIIIDFRKFENINFAVNFKNKSVKNIIAKNFNGSLKWLENFKQIEDLYLSFEIVQCKN